MSKDFIRFVLWTFREFPRQKTTRMKSPKRTKNPKKYSIDSFPSSVFYEPNEFVEIEKEIEYLEKISKFNTSRRATLINGKSDFNQNPKINRPADYRRDSINPQLITDGVDENLIYHGFYATVFRIFDQRKHPRDWCLKIITWPYPFRVHDR